jgi:hypothetical protein
LDDRGHGISGDVRGEPTRDAPAGRPVVSGWDRVAEITPVRGDHDWRQNVEGRPAIRIAK